MRTVGVVLALAVAMTLLVPLSACAASYRVLPVSQQLGPSRASAGASVEASSRTPATHGQGGGPASAPVADTEAPSGPTPSAANPTLPSNSPRLANPHPGGPGSFWYTTTSGERCIYEAASNGVCFNVVEPGGPGAAPEPPVNPAAIASGAAERLSLGTGRVQTSPSVQTNGLAGAPSWFWLEPSPGARSLTVALRGEHVTVTASVKEVQWAFGDGASLAGGAGVPYRPGSVPAGAVRHVYQTRCLPGDQGHDPNVLSSCGPGGYTVEALVQWAIGYTASGPVAGGGALPARTTASSIVYRVSVARAFLTVSGGGG